MDKRHSGLIVILLAGILYVLLFGREAAIAGLGSTFSILLVIGLAVAVIAIICLIVWLIIAAPRYFRQEWKSFRDGLRRARAEGHPTLWTYFALTGLIGCFAVFGFAAYFYFNGECRTLRTCLDQVPL